MEHLTELTIKNFKRFEHLQVEDIGQFNLIVGDNNVGKTSLLEALLFDEDLGAYFSNLIDLLEYNNITEDFVFLYFYNFHQIKSTASFLFSYSYGNDKHKILFKYFKGLEALNKKEQAIAKQYNLKQGYLGKLNNTITFIAFPKDLPDYSGDFYFPYIMFSHGYSNDLVHFYSQNIQLDNKAKKEFIQNLSSFIPNIEGIELTTRLTGNLGIEIVEKDTDTPRPLVTYGDGAIKLFRILLQIAVAKGRRLMIDEIDAGIHYSRFQEFWKIILQVAHNYQVQLFVTTHNPDCLLYYQQALEELKDFQEKSRVYTLMQLPDKSIKAYKHKFENFEFAIKQGIEIRGGNNG